MEWSNFYFSFERLRIYVNVMSIAWKSYQTCYTLENMNIDTRVSLESCNICIIYVE